MIGHRVVLQSTSAVRPKLLRPRAWLGLADAQNFLRWRDVMVVQSHQEAQTLPLDRPVVAGTDGKRCGVNRSKRSGYAMRASHCSSPYARGQRRPTSSSRTPVASLNACDDTSSRIVAVPCTKRCSGERTRDLLFAPTGDPVRWRTSNQGIRVVTQSFNRRVHRTNRGQI